MSPKKKLEEKKTALLTPLYLKSLEDSFVQFAKILTPREDEGFEAAIRDTIANQIAFRLNGIEPESSLIEDFMNNGMSADQAEVLDESQAEELIQDFILKAVNTQQSKQYDNYHQWLGDAQIQLRETLNILLEKSNDFSPAIQALAEALKDPTDANIQNLKSKMNTLLTNDNIHGKNHYPPLINCVCCLLNGEQRADNDPSSWKNDDLKVFIQQARVRLVNSPLIPHRFQWLSGGNALQGNPTEIKDIKKPWALYTRLNEQGMLITGHSGRLMAKVEQNMANKEKTELQTIFNYDGVAPQDHSIIIDIHSHENQTSSIGVGTGLVERAYRDFSRLKFSS